MGCIRPPRLVTIPGLPGQARLYSLLRSDFETRVIPHIAARDGWRVSHAEMEFLPPGAETRLDSGKPCYAVVLRASLSSAHVRNPFRGLVRP
jgi:hypothetical protein